MNWAVEIDESIPGLKPGMSAEVTIFTDSHRENALIVPLQAILGGGELGNVRKCFVKTSRGPVESASENCGATITARPIFISNSKMRPSRRSVRSVLMPAPVRIRTKSAGAP